MNSSFLNPPRVLIIDDDELLRQGLEYALVKLGFTPTLTGTPEEFMAYAKAGPYDLFLIDIQLADGHSGLELVDRIRAEFGNAPRIVMISGDGDIHMIATALRRGANDFILKPLDREHLIAKFRRYLRPERLVGVMKGSEEIVGETRIPGKLIFYSDIDEICENGVRLLSSHLVPKGTALWVGGELMREIAEGEGLRGPCLAKVTSTWMESDGEFEYGLQAEFDFVHSNPRWARAVRRWLASQP